MRRTKIIIIRMRTLTFRDDDYDSSKLFDNLSKLFINLAYILLDWVAYSFSKRAEYFLGTLFFMKYVNIVKWYPSNSDENGDDGWRITCIFSFENHLSKLSDPNFWILFGWQGYSGGPIRREMLLMLSLSRWEESLHHYRHRHHQHILCDDDVSTWVSRTYKESAEK